MRDKVIKVIIGICAIVGVIMFMGAVGNMDYMVEIGQDYPFSETLKYIFISILLMAPFCIREVL